MTILTLNAVGMTLSAPLFSNLNLTISKGDRIGLVAANGMGKSTLLACLAGEQETTTGTITRARGLRMGHVKQHVAESTLSAALYDGVRDALPAEQADYESWRVDVILTDLNVPGDLWHRPLAELSGGWQRMALLAAAWITEPDLLLLDEPTNHLDLRHIAVLQEWLSALPRDVPVVITSHDRAFLDATTNRTLFLRPEQSRVFPLPFSAARLAVAEADAADARRFANDLSKAQTLRRQAAKLKNVGINSGSDLLLTKTKQLTARAAQLEAEAKPAHRERPAGDIRLTNRGTHAKALITLEDVQVTTPDGALLYQTGQKWIAQGDRVVLLGGNGAGKTQLVKRINEALDGALNGVRCAASVVPAYADQKLSQLSGYVTAMQAITAQFDIGDHRARSVLANAGMDIRMQDAPIDRLSGGQKARLAMLILRLRNPNFYLLDEPTNHLDIEGQEALEAELISQSVSCVLVSHDRTFLRNVGTRYWWIRGRKLEEIDSPTPFLSGEMALR